MDLVKFLTVSWTTIGFRNPYDGIGNDMSPYLRTMNSAGLGAPSIHLASFGSVQSHLISSVSLVHSLDDINLSISRPVARISKPDSGPGSTAIRCVLDVEYEKTGVKLFLRRDAHRIPTVLCVGVCRVCSQENR